MMEELLGELCLVAECVAYTDDPFILVKGAQEFSSFVGKRNRHVLLMRRRKESMFRLHWRKLSQPTSPGNKIEKN